MKKRIFLSFCIFMYILTAGLFAQEKEVIKKDKEYKRVTRYDQKMTRPERRYIILWCDGISNSDTLYSRPDICRMLDKCMISGIDAVAVPAKLHFGYTTYNSLWAKKISVIPDSKLKVAEDFDMLKVFTEEAHKRDIDVIGVVTLFAGGDKKYKTGLYYEGNKDEISIINDIPYGSDKKVSQLASSIDTDGEKYDLSGGIVFGNPIHPEVQKRELRIISEVASNYNIDALILDKMRYGGLDSDFSPLSRREFEGFISQKIENFPGDILTIKKNPENGEEEIEQGKFFQEWCKWRSLNMKNFYQTVQNTIKILKPGLPVGINVGSWYPEYYEVGVNWGSELYIPGQQIDNKITLYHWARSWFSMGYQSTGLAAGTKFITAGCFYPAILKKDVDPKIGNWRTVEGGCAMASEATKGFTPILAGIDAGQYEGEKQKTIQALSVALEKSKGITIKDVSIIEKNNLWEDIARTVSVYNK